MNYRTALLPVNCDALADLMRGHRCECYIGGDSPNCLLLRLVRDSRWDDLRRISPNMQWCLCNRRYSGGKSALHFAVMQDNIGMVWDLLDWGAKVDSSDDQGVTSFGLSIARGNIEISRLLLDRGADPTHCDIADKTPLHYAADRANSMAVDLLIQWSRKNFLDFNAVSRDGRTPLFGAVELFDKIEQRVEITQKLIENGAIIDYQDSFGHTPFYWAELFGNQACLSVLEDAYKYQSMPCAA